MSTENASLAAIATSHLFKSLDPEARQQLLEESTAARFTDGQIIVREGDQGEALYIVKEGSVRVTTMRNGQQLELATLSRGACIGEVSLLSGRPRTATVVAVGDCTLLRFSGQAIEAVLAGHPRIRKLLESIVYGRARDTIEKITRPTGC
jgi:CRP-like cAMP-binding protein